ncbi:MAG: hypothetical protein WCP92_05260 [bacterium]
MKCRAKKIFKKPFDIKVSFKNSLGPVVFGSIKKVADIGSEISS